jgi:hypothetical protein
MKPAFWVGDYVRVKGDTSPGNNRPPELLHCHLFKWLKSWKIALVDTSK